MVDDNDRRYDERREEAGPHGRVGPVDHAYWNEQMEMDREAKACPICGGSGRVDCDLPDCDHEWGSACHCETCDGKGKVPRSRQAVRVDTRTSPDHCGGYCGLG